MNFAYGIIAIVGVLAAIVLGLVAVSPDDIIEPRIISVEEPTACTLQWEPMCGIDGETYGNLCMLDASDIKLDYKGECVIVQAEPEVVEPEVVEPEVVEPEVVEPEVVEPEVVEPEVVEPEVSSETLPMTLTISIPKGVGGTGCEKTDECYLPYEVTVAVGATVTWSNDDAAAHTVTSGIFPEPDGVFDSNMFMAGSTFEFVFDDAGDYDYYCFVHPWMDGIVHVS